MNGFDAIGPGEDLKSRAHALHRMRDAVIGGSRPALQPRGLVARSWSRALDRGLDPDGSNPRRAVPVEEVERRRRDSPLGAVIDDFRQMISTVADASQCLMVVTDADGVILWRDGAGRVRLRADDLGFTEGSVWTESTVGTNAIGTALAEAVPVQLFAAEHFEQGQLPWYCTAAPVHDPRTGDLLGVVDVSGPALTLHPMVGALVGSAARLAEMGLRQHHQRRLDRLRAAVAPRLAGIHGPLLLTDPDGWVAHSVGVPARERVSAPVADRPVAVPGMGLCLPERVAGGWLVRPHGPETTIRLGLDLTGPPAVEVTGGAEPWRARLSTRHAEILLLLHGAGRAGLSAAALSNALFGDTEHVVTARAEVSRLRKVLGAVVSTQPYRLADGVEMTVRAGTEQWWDCAFVQGSTAPGLRGSAQARRPLTG